MEIPEVGIFKWIVHMIDHATKYRWAKGLISKHATQVQLALREWWYEYGRPTVLHSDNGGEFTAELVEDICREWGVQMRHGRSYRPQTQGAIERAHRVLKAYLMAGKSQKRGQDMDGRIGRLYQCG